MTDRPACPQPPFPSGPDGSKPRTCASPRTRHVKPAGFLRMACLLMLMTMVVQTVLFGQTGQAFFNDPGIEFELPGSNWRRLDKKGNWRLFFPGVEGLENPTTGEFIVIDLPSSQAPPSHPDSMDWAKARVSHVTMESFRVEHIHGYALYLIDGLQTDMGAYLYIAVTQHPEGQWVTFYAYIPAENQAVADAQARDLLTRVRLHTHADIDRIFGYPLPASTDLDSLFQVKTDVIRREERGKIREAVTEAKIAQLNRDEFLFYAIDEFSWEKRYRVLGEMQSGRFSLQDALNYKIFNQKSQDMAFVLREFPNGEAAINQGVRQVILQHCNPPLDTALFKYLSYEQEYHAGKTYYWSSAVPADSSSCLLICYWRDGGVWQLRSRLIQPDFSYRYAQIEMQAVKRMDIRDAYPDESRVRYYKPIAKATLSNYPEDGFSQQVWAFNAAIPTSNVVALADRLTCDPPFDATYIVARFPGIDLGEDLWAASLYQTVDSIVFLPVFEQHFQAQFTLEKIRADKSLCKRIAVDGLLAGFLDGYGDDADGYYENHVRSAAYAIEGRKIPPAKRQYQSIPFLTDLDGNGMDEMVQFRLSNGLLLDYAIVEKSAEGVRKVPKSKEWEARIMALDYCQAMVRLSLIKANTLARWDD